MAATKIIILIFIFLVTLTAHRPRGHSYIKQPSNSSSGDGSSTTRYSILTYASTTHHPSATSPIPLNDTPWIMPTPPVVLQNEVDMIRKIERRDTADLSTSTSLFSNPPAPSISNDGLYTEEPFTTPPAPVIQNGGLHSATPLSPPTSSLSFTSTEGTSSTSVVEHGRRSVLAFTVLPQTTPASR